MSDDEVLVSMTHLRCTVDIRRDKVSPVFGFNGGNFSLCTGYFGGSPFVKLQKVSGVCRNPFRVSTRVECGRRGRIVTELSEETHFAKEFTPLQNCVIWGQQEDKIRRAIPDFSGELAMLVVLKTRKSDPPADTKYKVPQIECGVQTTLLSNEISCMENLSEELAQLMADGSERDVEFQCAGQTMKAHKLIVSRRSPVIASMLASDMVEGRTGVVTIRNMEPDIFSHFMRYIYSGKLGELTFDSALALHEAADQYAVHRLAKRCSEVLVELLSVDNACTALVIADAHNNETFVQQVVEYMVDNRVPYVREDWSAFCTEHSNLAVRVLNRECKIPIK